MEDSVDDDIYSIDRSIKTPHQQQKLGETERQLEETVEIRDLNSILVSF